MRHVGALLFVAVVMAATSAEAEPYQLLFESDQDVPNGQNELAVVTYPTIADIIANTSFDTDFTDLGVSAGYSSTGITWDGTAYRVLFESDNDIADGNLELALLSYATIDDIVVNTPFDSVFTDLGVSTGFSTTGITHLANDTQIPVPEPGQLPMVMIGLGFISLLVARRLRSA
jgi:hypothetical protein